VAGGDGEHAVVVGAGVAGLLAARVLAGRFARVTVVERDEVGGVGARFRAGVPQSRHVHILWARGLAAMERLLPGVGAELEAAGGVGLDAPRDTRWLSPADWFGELPGAWYLSVSRELLEATLRERVLGGPAVALLDRHEVTGLLPAPDGGDAVGGVRVRERGADGRESTVAADLVVVAAGRSARVAEWLAPLGRPAPLTERIDARLGYSSRYFARSSADPGWKAMYVQCTPEVPRGGAMEPIDGDRWIVTLIGQAEHRPPVDEDGWLAFAASLRSKELSQALAGARPLSDPVAFRATANEWTHFERAPRMPRGFLVLGDALCRFNPVYGHGMTVAAQQAEVLADRLASTGPAALAARPAETQKALAACLRGPWAIATGEDCRYPGTDGPRPGRLGRLQLGYMDRVVAAANTDPLVCETFFSVIALERRPESLLAPRIAARALRRRH
jgi:2-polyprenyl-6-methoxyphenol hydroxylase-like FAD-dependent oxidoreductase